MSEETEKQLADAALVLLGYSAHDEGCGTHIGEPCDCGYSEAHQNLRDLIEAADRRREHAAIANQIHSLTRAKSVTVTEKDLSQDGELTPVKEQGEAGEVDASQATETFRR